MNKNGAIGVIDSGVGGLTVAKEIAKNMPDENIIYLGDSKNCPYGNKSKEEILALTLKMINFLKEKGVKCVAIACNTISTLINDIRPHFDMPIVSIVECASAEVAAKKLKSVGLIATCFTVNSGAYNRLINEKLPDCKVTGRGSVNLANLVDRGDFNRHDINEEIKLCVDEIMGKEDIEALILGCTHYPIVEDNFRECYPKLKLINPAVAQMNEVDRILKAENAENTDGGSFNLFTTGEPENYIKVIEKLGFKKPDTAKNVIL